ncbi:hypothetical protein BDY24DRAFT_383694 [Mrakia frigida]|uniref:uncharacterized protein n=1 Tax=Mrakia frigida TaxID=29902 RepID=UPI003FCBF688
MTTSANPSAITIISPPTPPSHRNKDSPGSSSSSPSSSKGASFRKHPHCPMYDIVQFACQPHFRYDPKTGARLPGGTVTCYPVPRVFRKCPGMPAVDVSKVLMNNDGVFPTDQPLPKGQPWDTVKPLKREPFRLNH